jgi:hypothetical protein
VIIDYLRLWDFLADFQLQPGIEDRRILRFSASGQYSAKTVYEGFFLGELLSDIRKKFGRLGPRANALFSCGLLPTTVAGLWIV